MFMFLSTGQILIFSCTKQQRHSSKRMAITYEPASIESSRYN